MIALRWFVKENGEKVLQVRTQSDFIGGRPASDWFDIPTIYENDTMNINSIMKEIKDKYDIKE
jgi:hypothetical protein